MFMLLCKRSLEVFYLATLRLYARSTLIPPPLTLGNYLPFYFVSLVVTALDTSYEWNPTVFVLL